MHARKGKAMRYFIGQNIYWKTLENVIYDVIEGFQDLAKESSVIMCRELYTKWKFLLHIFYPLWVFKEAF